MNDNPSYWALALADQAEAEITDKGLTYAQTYLAEAGLSLDDLSEEGREVLTLGVRAGVIAHLAWSRGIKP